MRARGLATLAVAVAVGGTLAGCGSSSSTSHVPAAAALRPIGAGLRGPAGLAAFVYARGPATLAALAFDSHGRLWGAAAGLSTHRLDGVYLLSAGSAAPRLVIGGLDDPLGLLWLGSTLYVSSVGRVDAYSGFDGARFARHRQVLSGPVAHGENNDLVLAPNGRLLMGITATCDHCVPSSPYSGSIVSFDRNGHGLRLYASRIRAPVGLAFYPGTNNLLASMNQRDDLGSRTPGDWLAVVQPGSDWRFPGCYGQRGTVCAGVPKPLAVLDKHAAVGPVVLVIGSFADSDNYAALVSEWQTSRVARVAISRHGDTYTGSTSTWLTGIRDPFAMVLAPGGSLVVGDWASGRVYGVAVS